MAGEHLPKRGPGRPKGSPNKLGKAAKEVIAAAAEELGGQARLVAWVKEDPKNEGAFWGSIYPKLLPLTVGGDADNPLITGFQVTFVDPGNTDTA